MNHAFAFNAINMHEIFLRALLSSVCYMNSKRVWWLRYRFLSLPHLPTAFGAV